MRKNISLCLTLILATAIALSFGSFNTTVQAQGTKVFAGAWPYRVPPDGHFNTYATGFVDSGIYLDLMEPPLAVYMWAQGSYEGILAESFGFDSDNNYVVKVKTGIKWSDGTDFSSADVVSHFQVAYLLSNPLWTQISNVEAVDAQTVKFTFSAPSKLGERRILTENIRAASVYGEIAKKAADLIAKGIKSDADEFKAVREELTNFRPEEYVSAGPYKMDKTKITDAKLTLVKNPGGYASETVKFDEVVLWNGETETVTPLVANGELFYATHGFPPATEKSFIDAGIDIIRGPTYSGPALYFNYGVYPLDKVEVRQAMAYVIDREQNGEVSLGASGIAHEYMIGFSDNLAPLFFSADELEKFNTYDLNREMATQLLEGIGFKKGADGVWVDDKGNPLAFELKFPSEFLDWAAAAENVTQQLNDFGFKITARGVQFQQQEQDVYDNNFQLAIRNWGIGSPFPGQAYLQPYDRYNGRGQYAGEEKGGGMRMPDEQTYSGGTIKLREVALQSGEGLDEAKQKALIAQLAQSFNELLPCVPLWERYGNNPLNRKFLDAPAGDDPVYKNAGVDHFIPYLILTGKIGPAAG